MDIKQQFDETVSESKSLQDRPSNDTLLQLYSLYKQSTEETQIQVLPLTHLILLQKPNTKPGRS